MHWIKEEYRKLDRSPRALRRFGLTVGSAFLLLGLVLSWRHHRGAGWPVTSIGSLLLIAAALAPATLKYAHGPWMIVSLALGWVVTRILLTIVFCLIVTPIGLLQRLCGKRPLEFGFKSDETTYWQRRTAGQNDYEKQF